MIIGGANGGGKEGPAISMFSKGSPCCSSKRNLFDFRNEIVAINLAFL